NADSGTSGTWEGDFLDGGAVPPPYSGRFHSFGLTNYNAVLPGGQKYRADLFWSDPIGGSANDYDLAVVDSTGTNVVLASFCGQNGSQDPYECIGAVAPGESIVIVKTSGESRFLHLDTGRGRLSITTPGRIRGHSAAAA